MAWVMYVLQYCIIMAYQCGSGVIASEVFLLLFALYSVYVKWTKYISLSGSSRHRNILCANGYLELVCQKLIFTKQSRFCNKCRVATKSQNQFNTNTTSGTVCLFVYRFSSSCFVLVVFLIFCMTLLHAHKSWFLFVSTCTSTVVAALLICHPHGCHFRIVQMREKYSDATAPYYPNVALWYGLHAHTRLTDREVLWILFPPKVLYPFWLNVILVRLFAWCVDLPRQPQCVFPLSQQWYDKM